MARRPFVSPSRVASRVPTTKDDPPAQPPERPPEEARPRASKEPAPASTGRADPSDGGAVRVDRTAPNGSPGTTDAPSTTATGLDPADLEPGDLEMVARSHATPRTSPTEQPRTVDRDPEELDRPDLVERVPTSRVPHDAPDADDGASADPELAEWHDLQSEVGAAHADVQDAEDDVADAYEDLADAIRGLHLAQVEGRELDVPVWEAQVHAYTSQLEHQLAHLEQVREDLGDAQGELADWEAEHVELVVDQTGATPEERALEDELTELREQVRALELQTDTSHGGDWAERVEWKQGQLHIAHAEAAADVATAQGALATAQGEYATSLAKLSTWFAQQDEDFDLGTYDPVAQIGNALDAAAEGDLGGFTAEWLADVQDDFDLPADLAAELTQSQLALQAAIGDLADAELALHEAAGQLDALDGIAALRDEEDAELAEQLEAAQDALEAFEQDHEEFVEAYDAARQDPGSDALETQYDFEAAALELEAAEEARIGAYEEVVEAQAQLDQLRASDADPEAILRQEVALEVAMARLDRFDRLVEQASREAGHAEDDLQDVLEELAQEGQGDDLLTMDPADALDDGAIGIDDLTNELDEAVTPADELTAELDEAMAPADQLTPDADVLSADSGPDLEFGVGGDPVTTDGPMTPVAEVPAVADEVTPELAEPLVAMTPEATDAVLADPVLATEALADVADAQLEVTELEAADADPVAFDHHDPGAGLDEPFD